MNKGLERINYLMERNNIQKKWETFRVIALEVLTGISMVGCTVLLILLFWVLM